MHREGENLTTWPAFVMFRFIILGMDDGRERRIVFALASLVCILYPTVNPIRCSHDANLCTERRQDLNYAGQVAKCMEQGTICYG